MPSSTFPQKRSARVAKMFNHRIHRNCHIFQRERYLLGEGKRQFLTAISDNPHLIPFFKVRDVPHIFNRPHAITTLIDEGGTALIFDQNGTQFGSPFGDAGGGWCRADTSCRADTLLAQMRNRLAMCITTPFFCAWV